MKRILIIDTETATGFKPKDATWYETPDKLPKLAQVSFITCRIEVSEGGVYYPICKNEFDYIIYPKDNLGEWIIEEKNEEIHKISTNIAIDNGFDIDKVFNILLEHAGYSDLIIGHNLYFDTENILAASEITGSNNVKIRTCSKCNNEPTTTDLKESICRCGNNKFELHNVKGGNKGKI